MLRVRGAEQAVCVPGRDLKLPRLEKGIATDMLAPLPIGEPTPRPSRVIAEALVGRYGPRQITALTSSLGFPRQLTQVIVAACTSTACDTSWTRRRNIVVAR